MYGMNDLKDFDLVLQEWDLNTSILNVYNKCINFKCMEDLI